MWFPSYKDVALRQLLAAVGNSLGSAVAELLLMEGEEPFERRATALADAAPRTQDTPDPSEFPALGASQAPAAPQQCAAHSSMWAKVVSGGGGGGGGSGGVGGFSSPRDSQPAGNAQFVRDGRSRAFWQLDADGSGGGSARPSGPRMAGGAPVVDSGDSVRALYEGARADARAHAVARHECFRRATSAFVSGHRDLARRLSSEARRHGDAMAEADARAAAHIFRARNAAWSGGTASGAGFLDLHGLHVKEACALLSSVLQQRSPASYINDKRPARKLMVCAGAGIHSERPTRRAAAAAAASGSAPRGRLEQAIERLLSQRGHTYREMHAGLFEVVL